MQNKLKSSPNQVQFKFNSRLIQDFRCGYNTKLVLFNLSLIMENYEIFTSHK